MNNITIPEIAAMLRSAPSVLILTHAHPDGDTVGSAYALLHALEGKEVYVVCDDILPERLRILADGAESLSPARLPEGFTPALTVAVDLATLSLAGDYGKALEGKIDLRIDHHETKSSYAKYEYVRSESGSCGEIVFDILEEMGAINAASALPLYGAIISDTGSFRYDSVTPETHRKAAELLRCGIPHSEIAHQLLASNTRSEAKAIGMAYRSLRFYDEGRIAVVLFTNEMKTECGLSDAELSVINSLPREISGVSLGIVIKQVEGRHDRFRLSMRSDASVDVNRLCALFDGGGHPRAAGGAVDASTPEEAVRAVVGTVFHYLDRDH